MAKQKTVFTCQECGFESPKWQGRCPECGAWSSLAEETARVPARKSAGRGNMAAPPPLPITEIPSDEGSRLLTGLDEFDRILGGGIIEGSVSLIGGEPGVGKSTLMLQVAHRLGLLGRARPVLYVTGEESARQTKMRAERLGACKIGRASCRERV